MPIHKSAAKVIGDTAAALSSAGTTSATATVCYADHVSVTSVTLGGGVILSAGNSSQIRSVGNHTSLVSGASLLVYPPSGASINGGAADAPLNLPAASAAIFIFVTSLIINCVVT